MILGPLCSCSCVAVTKLPNRNHWGGKGLFQLIGSEKSVHHSGDNMVGFVDTGHVVNVPYGMVTQKSESVRPDWGLGYNLQNLLSLRSQLLKVPQPSNQYHHSGNQHSNYEPVGAILNSSHTTLSREWEDHQIIEAWVLEWRGRAEPLILVIIWIWTTPHVSCVMFGQLSDTTVGN